MKKNILINYNFIPIGIKPNVDVSEIMFQTHSLVIFDDNYVLISNEHYNLINELKLEIYFPANFKAVPEKMVSENYIDIAYKIRGAIYDFDYISSINDSLLPYTNISEDSLFYIKLLNSDLFVDKKKS